MGSVGILSWRRGCRTWESGLCRRDPFPLNCPSLPGGLSGDYRNCTVTVQTNYPTREYGYAFLM